MSLRSVLLAGGFAALASLVAAGTLTSADQWAVDHLMPGASFHHAKESLLDGLVPLYHSRWNSVWAVTVNLVTLPASFLVALAIVAACSRALAAALLAAVVVEGVCKEVLTRPPLHHGSLHIAPFDSSFPSGHALRTVLVAAGVAWTWPRVRTVAVAWAIATIPVLLLAGWHTPTDLAGGLILAWLALLGARSARALGARRLATRA